MRISSETTKPISRHRHERKQNLFKLQLKRQYSYFILFLGDYKDNLCVHKISIPLLSVLFNQNNKVSLKFSCLKSTFKASNLFYGSSFVPLCAH
jgi:hypothetical protein